MHYKFLTSEREQHIAVVTLNRPDSRNALNAELLTEIEQAVLSFRDDADTRVVIFTGNGRHFCAGADIAELTPDPDESLVARRRRLRLGERVMRALLGMDQISVCAWNGGAIGGGGCLATATDFRIGAEDCFLHYPEIDLGFNLMWQSLPRTGTGGNTVAVGPARTNRSARRAALAGKGFRANLRGETANRGANDQAQYQCSRRTPRSGTDAHGCGSTSAHLPDCRSPGGGRGVSGKTDRDVFR